MNISFKEWFYKESAESDAVENLKNSLLELTDKSKYDLVMFFQKALRTPKDEIKDIEFHLGRKPSNLIKTFKNKKFSTELDKNNEIIKLIKSQPLSSIIDDAKNFDQSKKEKFKNNDLEFFKKEAIRNFMNLFSIVPSLMSFFNKDDFDIIAISKAFVNPFSYLNKEEKYKMQDYIDLSNEKFIEKIKRMVISKHKRLQLDKTRSKEISGYGGDDEKSSIADIAVAGSTSRVDRGSKSRSGKSMLSFTDDDYEYDYGSNNSNSILSDDEFNEFKKIIHEEASKDEFRKFAFCTIEGLDFDKLLVPNYYTDIDEIIRNQNKLQSLKGKSKFLQIYEIIRSMIESSDINEKRKGIKLQMYLGGDEQGNPSLFRGISNFITSIGGQYRTIKRNIISKSKLISDNPKWHSILEKWKNN